MQQQVTEWTLKVVKLSLIELEFWMELGCFCKQNFHISIAGTMDITQLTGNRHTCVYTKVPRGLGNRGMSWKIGDSTYIPQQFSPVSSSPSSGTLGFSGQKLRLMPQDSDPLIHNCPFQPTSPNALHHMFKIYILFASKMEEYPTTSHSFVYTWTEMYKSFRVIQIACVDKIVTRGGTITSKPAGENWADLVHCVKGWSPRSFTRENMFLYGYQNPGENIHKCRKSSSYSSSNDELFLGGNFTHVCQRWRKNACLPWMPTSTERPPGVCHPATRPPGWAPASSSVTSKPCTWRFQILFLSLP